MTPFPIVYGRQAQPLLLDFVSDAAMWHCVIDTKNES